MFCCGKRHFLWNDLGAQDVQFFSSCNKKSLNSTFSSETCTWNHCDNFIAWRRPLSVGKNSAIVDEVMEERLKCRNYAGPVFKEWPTANLLKFVMSKQSCKYTTKVGGFANWSETRRTRTQRLKTGKLLVLEQLAKPPELWLLSHEPFAHI